MSANALSHSGVARPPASSLRRKTLIRVFLRSLFLQASWNPKGMQNLGLAYAVYPALKDFYPEEDKLHAAVKRHLVFFNTHPYVAAAIVGGVLYHEDRIRRGEETPDRVVSFKAALMGPLAALGDGFFWLSLKPAVGALCAALVPILRGWAPVLFLVLYNAVHFSLRARLFWMGLSKGDKLVEELARSNLPGWGARLRHLGAASAGGLAAWLAITFGRNEGGYWASALTAGCLAAGGLAYWLVSKRFSNDAVLYLVALLAVAAGAFL